jgi:hypothetical protein
MNAFADQSLTITVNAGADQLAIQLGPNGFSVPIQSIRDLLSGVDRDPIYLAWQIALLINDHYPEMPDFDADLATFLSAQTYRW